MDDRIFHLPRLCGMDLQLQQKSSTRQTFWRCECKVARPESIIWLAFNAISSIGRPTSDPRPYLEKKEVTLTKPSVRGTASFDSAAGCGPNHPNIKPTVFFGQCPNCPTTGLTPGTKPITMFFLMSNYEDGRAL